MKRLILLLLLGMLIAGGWYAYPRLQEVVRKRNLPKFETEEVTRGTIRWGVQASGQIQPILKVQIGAFVSGPIVELNADFNDKVEKGKLLAKVDPRLYEAAVERDTAALLRSEAEVLRVKAQLQQSINDFNRARELHKMNEGYISQSEMDQLRFARQAREAEFKVAKLQIEQSRANLENSLLNLNYTEIRAPESGVIIDRKIDPGQTLTAQFQTPELFVLAPQMDERMWVHASVVEADVGHVLKAKEEGRKVEFYVDAYEGELFHGKIIQVRQNPLTEQNVVTYPVIVETPNPDLKLLPGMTANLSFEVDRRDDVLQIPSEAIRFLPDRRYVREEDHDILDGKDSEERDSEAGGGSAEQRVAAFRRRRRRHVWVEDTTSEGKLRAVPIEFGISDGRYYELIEGDLEEGQGLVYNVQSGRG